MLDMDLTQKHTVLDEKTLQNVAFVIFLLRCDMVSWVAAASKRGEKTGA